MARTLGLVYGLAAYLIFLFSFLYLIGFVGDLVVPKSIDSGTSGSLGLAAVVDVFLVALFGIQHSVMARPWFKRWWVRIVSKPLERSTFVLFTSLILLLMFWQWRPLTQAIWSVGNPVVAGVLWALFCSGWLLVLASSYMIDHFDLFGLKQVYVNFRGLEYTPPPFKTSWLYGRVRHPLMTGFIIGFWATPTMTLGHFLFAVALTGYILFAIRLEEHDLTAVFGDTYKQYRKRVSMLFPSVPRGD
jgi:methanethiol S-methyltransferase